jgi:sugar lactone lactonase YvrE
MSAVLGVYADERSGLLYACSIGGGAPPDKADALSALRTFDLKTGAARSAYPMPGGAKSLCNDIATARDGTVYVSETIGGRVLRLKKGATSLEEWVKAPELGAVDGIAIGGDGAVYVNTVRTGRMFRIPLGAGGSAGAVTELKPSVKLGGPDGLRALGGNRFLQAENGAGRVSVVTVSGATATVTPVKEGLAQVTSAVVVKGQVWAVDAKFRFRQNPDFKDKDPGPFTVDPMGPLPR